MKESWEKIWCVITVGTNLEPIGTESSEVGKMMTLETARRILEVAGLGSWLDTNDHYGTDDVLTLSKGDQKLYLCFLTAPLYYIYLAEKTGEKTRRGREVYKDVLVKKVELTRAGLYILQA
jgi:hypothetical protein